MDAAKRHGQFQRKIGLPAGGEGDQPDQISNAPILRYFKTSLAIICPAVMMLVHYALSQRNIENLLHECGAISPISGAVLVARVGHPLCGRDQARSGPGDAECPTSASAFSDKHALEIDRVRGIRFCRTLPAHRPLPRDLSGKRGYLCPNDSDGGGEA
jgi:hypothetical protein